MLGTHFPTWMFAILVLITYFVASYMRKEPVSQKDRFPSIKIAVGSVLAPLPVLFVGLVIPEVSISIESAWPKITANLIQLSPLNFISFVRDEALLSSYFANGSYAKPLAYALSLFGLCKLHRIREAHVRLMLSWAIVASLGILVIPKFEQWRLLYMIPIEVLAAVGVLDALTSANLLKDFCIANCGGKMFLRGIGLSIGLLVWGVIPFVVSATSLPALLGFMTMEWFLSYDLGHGEVSRIATIELVLLYVLAGMAHALYSLR